MRQSWRLLPSRVRALLLSHGRCFLSTHLWALSAGVLAHTAEAIEASGGVQAPLSARELRLVQSQGDITHPRVSIKAVALP